MNGIILFMGILLICSLFQLLIEQNWVAVALFCLALALIFLTGKSKK